MLDQQANFIHLKKMAEHQKKVRNCIVEGMIEDVESSFTHIYECGLISMSHLEELEDVLTGDATLLDFD